MASANLAAALNAVLRHEGGYVDHPSDPGGATNLGITRATLAQWRGRAVSKAEVRALTKAEAGTIYRALYWDEIQGDRLPAGLDSALFDYAVNSGAKRAVRTLQAVLGVPADGRMGALTLEAAHRWDCGELVRRVCAKRLSFLEGLRTFAIFGRGWRRRVRATEGHALGLIVNRTTKGDFL